MVQRASRKRRNKNPQKNTSRAHRHTKGTRIKYSHPLCRIEKLIQFAITQALAGTIQRDPTAPHFKYHDDPYLIPLSNRTKRMYALAQESGRKAAMWIKEQHPELFQHQLADPPIGVSIQTSHFGF